MTSTKLEQYDSIFISLPPFALQTTNSGEDQEIIRESAKELFGYLFL